LCPESYTRFAAAWTFTKKFLVATIIKTEGITPTYLKKRFSAFNNQLRLLRDWLLGNH